MREGVMAFSSSFGRSSRHRSGKQEVAVRRPGASTQLLHEEDKGDFADSPLGFGFFLEILKTAHNCDVL
jgi:hypothetical protein